MSRRSNQRIVTVLILVITLAVVISVFMFLLHSPSANRPTSPTQIQNTVQSASMDPAEENFEGIAPPLNMGEPSVPARDSKELLVKALPGAQLEDAT